MIIQVYRIPWDGLDLEESLPAALLELQDDADHLKPAGPVECRLHAQIAAHDVIVRGKLSLKLEFVCSRCGDPFERTVEAPDFEEIYPFTDPHDSLDLTCDIRETIILAFPSFPICAATCKGVCGHCGVNRNRSHCTCHDADRDERWSALEVVALRPKQ